MAGNSVSETLTASIPEMEKLDIGTQFIYIGRCIDFLRHPERSHDKEVERAHNVDFESGTHAVQFVSPFQRVANISIEYPNIAGSHNFFVDIKQQIVRRTIWQSGRITQSDLVLSQPETLITKREYPRANPDAITQPQVLDAEEALQLISVVHAALNGLQRALA